jgi:hypothetical protein
LDLSNSKNFGKSLQFPNVNQANSSAFVCFQMPRNRGNNARRCAGSVHERERLFHQFANFRPLGVKATENRRRPGLVLSRWGLVLNCGLHEMGRICPFLWFLQGFEAET